MALKPFFSKMLAEQEEQHERHDLLTNPARRQEAFDRGLITVKDLDDEELRAGKCRNKFGKIPRTSGKTEPIPRDLYDEMVQEHELRINHNLRDKADRMVNIMIGVAEDETVEPRDRLEAAKYVFERSFGKTPERVQVAVAKMPWEEMVGGIAKLTRTQSQAIRRGEANMEDYIDAETVDDGTVNVPAGGNEHNADNEQARHHFDRGQSEPVDWSARTQADAGNLDQGGRQTAVRPTDEPLVDARMGAKPKRPAQSEPEPSHEFGAPQTDSEQVPRQSGEQHDYVNVADLPLSQGPAHRYGNVEYEHAPNAPSFDNPEQNSATSMPYRQGEVVDVPPLYADSPYAGHAQSGGSNTLGDVADKMEALALARKAAKKRVQDAKKARIVARNMGKDAVPKVKVEATEIPSESGDGFKLRFDATTPDQV